MSKLYILGNGFDRAHDMLTDYDHFNKFLTEHNGYNDLAVCLNELVHIEADWSDFEVALGNPNEEFFECLHKLFSREFDGKAFQHKLQLAFNNWISVVNDHSFGNGIKIGGLEPSSDDYYISFNYTCVLELLYNIPSDNVKHIHGFIGDVLFGNTKQLIFGHNKKSDDPIIGKWLEATYKDTTAIIEKNADYFESLSKKRIDKIVVFGFSYSEIDMDYIRRIKAVLPNVPWEMHCFIKYDNTALKNCINYIEKLGIANHAIVLSCE